MSNLVKLIASLLAASLMGGCSLVQAEPQPAWLTNMSPAVKAELQQALVELIGGEPVKLADTAFGNTHQLFIEQAILRDPQGRPIMGRHQQPAILIELQHLANRCTLSHPASGRSVQLSISSCQPAVSEQ